MVIRLGDRRSPYSQHGNDALRELRNATGTYLRNMPVERPVIL